MARDRRALGGLDQDIRDHIERETDENIARGMTPEEARRQALLAFGNPAIISENARAVWVWSWLDEIRQDVRYALRTLRRSPGFAFVAILTLGVGIGATTAVYSVVDTVLLRPLPFDAADRLVRIVENIPRPEPKPAAVPARRDLPGVPGMAGADLDPLRPGRHRTFDRHGENHRRHGAVVGCEYLGLAGLDTGLRPLLGRTFVPDDDRDPNVVLLGFNAWQQLFHADRDVVGKPLEFLSSGQQSRLFTIVGVLPSTFELAGAEGDFYTPLAVDDAAKARVRVTLLGRLRPDVTLEAALQDANVIGAAITTPPPANTPPRTAPRFEVERLKDRAVKELRPALQLFLAAVTVVLVIVCANLANLLLARGSARQREIAVRCAIGASRGRVVRQILTECAVLSLMGGALGALVGALGITLVRMLASVEAPGIFQLSFGASILPRVNEIAIDLRVLGIAFGAAAVTSLVFGLLPALHLSRPNRFQAIGPRGATPSRGASRLRAGLVLGQLVMATALLVGAALLIRSFATLSGIDRGYDPSNVLAFQLVFPPSYPIARKVETIESLLARLRAVPDVRSAGFTRAGMLIGEQITLGTFVPEGRTVDQMESYRVRPSLRPVSPGYLTAMGVRVLDGRELEADGGDPSTPEIVISRSVVPQFGPGSPVGTHCRLAHGQGPADAAPGGRGRRRPAQHLTGSRSRTRKSSFTIGDCWRSSSDGGSAALAARAFPRAVVVRRPHPQRSERADPGGWTDRPRR